MLSITPVSRADFTIAILVAMVAGSLIASAYGVAVFHGQSVADARALADNFGRLSVQIGDNTIDPNAYSDAILLPFCLLLMLGLHGAPRTSRSSSARSSGSPLCSAPSMSALRAAPSWPLEPRSST